MNANPRTRSLAQLLEQAYFGADGGDDAWHGPSLRALLRGVTAERARARPVAGRHSIWELVLHMAVWDEICVRRLRGEEIAMTTGSAGDWPEVGETSPPAWDAALRRLVAAQTELVSMVRGMADDALALRVAGRDWRNELVIHGTLHHDLYHAGQIALLR